MKTALRRRCAAPPSTARGRLHAILQRPLRFRNEGTCAVAFGWTAFRLADRDERKQLLWIIFAQIFAAFWVSAAVLLGWLAGVTASPAISVIGAFFAQTYHPLINKTTVYGGAVLVLAVVFAGVEQLAQTQLATRLAIIDGMGAWIGAGAVAVAMGPIQSKPETAFVLRTGVREYVAMKRE